MPPTPRLVGRTDLLASVEGHLASGGSVVLTGSSGIGKTAIVDTIGAAAAERGERVLRVAGAETERWISFAGLADLLSQMPEEFVADLPEPQRAAVNAVLLRPLPYPDQGQLAVVFDQFPSMNLMEFPASIPEYLDYRDQNRSFAHLAAYLTGGGAITGDGEAERVQFTTATWQLFPAFGVEPQLGRVYGEEDDRPGAADVVTASLLLHHLEPAAAARSLAEMRAAARRGVVINDLLRSRMTLGLVWVVTRLFTRHPFARHDGPLSVRRAYSPQELRAIAARAGVRRLDVRRYPWLGRIVAVAP